MKIDELELKQFCIDVLEVMAGIGWFDVREEEDRIYKFIDTYYSELLQEEKKIEV